MNDWKNKYKKSNNQLKIVCISEFMTCVKVKLAE